MKRAQVMRTFLLICILVGMLAGCGSKAPSWESFEGALNEKSFPVPQEANSPDRTTTNAAMDYVRYSLPGLKEKEDLPEPYAKAIESWGWHELVKEKTANSYVFQKDELIVHLSVHNGYFIIMVPKDKKATVLNNSGS